MYGQGLKALILTKTMLACKFYESRDLSLWFTAIFPVNNKGSQHIGTLVQKAFVDERKDE